MKMEITEKMGTEVIREIMREEGVTHATLAEKLGYKSVSGVTGRLSTPRISTDKMVEMLAAMGYEVIVRKAEVEDSEERKEWRVVG